MRSEREVRGRLETWRGFLAGIEAGLNGDGAEVFARLPEELYATALELLKADPVAQHLASR